MKSKWKVSKNPIGGDGYVYQVYRNRNVGEVDHSGNREIYDVYDSMTEAEGEAERLNREEYSEEVGA